MSKSIMPNVFIGIDVHKRTYSITAVSNNIVIKHASMPADKKTLLGFLNNHFSGYSIHSVYEAGFSGFGLHRFLKSNGINSIVVHAASIEVAANIKSKTDKRDSNKMAVQLSQGRLKCVNIPSPEREHWRAITRLRLQYVRDRSRIACRIKGLLFHFDMIPFSHKGKTSRKWILSLLKMELEFNEDVFYTLKHLIQNWLYLDEKIKEVNKRLKEQARKDFKIHNVYIKQCGLGLIASRTLANELDDLSQFKSERALSCWLGLTPIEHSSGDHRWLGHITRQGNPIIRGILIECAWRAIRKDSYLGKIFDRLVRNTGSRKKAIVGIAKKLICQIRTRFRKADSYKPYTQRKSYDLVIK